MSLIKLTLHASTKEVTIKVIPLKLIKETPKGYRVAIKTPLGELSTTLLAKEDMGKIKSSYMVDTHYLFIRTVLCRDTDEDIARVKLLTELQLHLHKVKSEFEPMYNKSMLYITKT